jgi:hypothetical protein
VTGKHGYHLDYTHWHTHEKFQGVVDHAMNSAKVASVLRA